MQIRFLLPILALTGLGLTTYAAADSKAKDDMKKVEQVMKGGEVATSATGYAMKATVGGKDWTASSMMRVRDTGRILGLKGEDSISLPYSKSRTVTGRTVKFSETNAVDLFSTEHPGVWSATTGEMTFTKVDDTWAEGTFFFTATKAGKGNEKIEVTNGTFRVMLPQRK